MLKMLAFVLIFFLCSIFLAQVFRGDLILSSTIFKFGRFELRYYSLFILLGIAISYYLARRRAKKENIALDQLDELIFYAVIFGILGARLFYVLFNWRYYQKNPLEIFMVWHGGVGDTRCHHLCHRYLRFVHKVEKKCQLQHIPGSRSWCSLPSIGTGNR